MATIRLAHQVVLDATPPSAVTLAKFARDVPGVEGVFWIAREPSRESAAAQPPRRARRRLWRRAVTVPVCRERLALQVHRPWTRKFFAGSCSRLEVVGRPGRCQDHRGAATTHGCDHRATGAARPPAPGQEQSAIASVAIPLFNVSPCVLVTGRADTVVTRQTRAQNL